MPSSRYSRQSDDYYDDAPRERRRSSGPSGRVRDVSYSELQSIREREIGSMDRRRYDEDMGVVRRSRTMQDDQPYGDAMVRKSRTQDDQIYGDDTGSRASRRTGRRDRYKDDNDYEYRRSRRRDSAPDYEGGEGRRSGRRERERERGSQAEGQQVAQYQQKQQQQRGQEESEGNGQGRGEDCFFERRFDRGSDGVITAAAGAALGAITARHFFGPKEFSQESETRQGKLSKNWKMIGGAVVGATALNLAQNKFKTYYEEKEDRREDAEMGLETIGELIGAAAPDVM